MRSVRVSQCAPKLPQGAPHFFQAHILLQHLTCISQLQALDTGI